MSRPSFPGKLRRLLPRLLGVLLSLAAMVTVAFSLILSRPERDATALPPAQPLLAGSPAVQITSEEEIPGLMASFPAPVMSFMSGSGLRFVSGVSADISLQGGFGRVVTLYWQTEDGEPLILDSIYPASALTLLRQEAYRFSRTAGPVLFGQDSVRMENGDKIRVHTATDTGLYAVTLPRSLSGRLSSIARSLQLFMTQEPDDTP